MRLTIELRGKEPAVSMDLHPYIGLCAKPLAWLDARVELTVWDGDTDGATTVDIETGSVGAMRHVLQTALGMLDDMEALYKGEATDRAQHAIPCGVCGTYYDARQPVIEHADGRGNTCLGDGTVLTRMPLELAEAGTWRPIALGDVKDGQTLRWADEDADKRPFTAVGDAQQRYVASFQCASLYARVQRLP